MRSTGKFYALGGTYYGLEGDSTVWRNTAICRNILRSGRNILRPGGAQYYLEEHCCVQEHATARRNTLRSGGAYYRLEDLCLLQRRINTNTNCGCYIVHQGVWHYRKPWEVQSAWCAPLGSLLHIRTHHRPPQPPCWCWRGWWHHQQRSRTAQSQTCTEKDSSTAHMPHPKVKGNSSKETSNYELHSYSLYSSSRGFNSDRPNDLLLQLLPLTLLQIIYYYYYYHHHHHLLYAGYLYLYSWDKLCP